MDVTGCLVLLEMPSMKELTDFLFKEGNWVW